MLVGTNVISSWLAKSHAKSAAAGALVMLACSSQAAPSQNPSPVQGSGGTTSATTAGAGAGAGQSGLSGLSGAGALATQGAGRVASAGTSATAGQSGASAGMGGASSIMDDADAGPASAGQAGASGNAGTSASAGAGGAPSSTKMPADYTKAGPYMTKRLLNQGMGTISGGSSALLPLGNNNDPSAFTLYFPDGAPAGERFPLLTFGNGTFCSPTFYDVLIGHVVSYGFIVVATNTSNTGSAEEMLKAVEWAEAQDKQSGSPIFERVDSEHVGAFGHSQGGAGTCRAGADPRIHAIAPLSGPSDAANIKCPVFFTTSGGEAESSSSVEDAFKTVMQPAVYGVTMSGNHDEYTDVADDPGVSGLTSDDARQSRAAIAAWFEWQLKGKAEVKSLFVGTDCGFCKGSTWKTIESKGF